MKCTAAAAQAWRDCHCKYCNTRLPSSLAWMLTPCSPSQRVASASLRTTSAWASACWHRLGTSYSIIWVNHSA
ncbi:hypothetical protein D3C71_2139970 [compost metagenome]